jgi:hypothetical protein
MKKLLLLTSALFLVSPVSASEITSRITDSVQLTVEGPAIHSTRIGSSYTVSGSNISVTTLGGLTSGSATAPSTITAGDYDVASAGEPFAFSESSFTGDTVITAGQNDLSTNGRFADANIYGSSTTSAGGTAGDLAGALSATSVPTVTAGGTGTTAVGQRTLELTVFQ